MTEPVTVAEWEAFFAQRDAARAAYDRMRCQAMRGNDALAAAVRANWEPIRHVQRSQHTNERQDQQDKRLRRCGIVN